MSCGELGRRPGLTEERAVHIEREDRVMRGVVRSCSRTSQGGRLGSAGVYKTTIYSVRSVESSQFQYKDHRRSSPGKILECLSSILGGSKQDLLI
jgi:hypothetical protein